MAEGTITRKDIITDDALRWGDEYAKTLNEAVAKNKEFVDSIILLNAENVKLRRSENQTEFIKQKNEVKLISEKAISLIKEQQVAESSLEKVKQEALKTEKLALDIAKKKQDATRATIKLTVEERLANEQKNRAEKEQAILSSKLTTAYTKLNLQRTIAKRNLLDLLSAENQNIEAIKKAQIEFDRLDVRVRKADQAVGDFHKSVGNYPKITKMADGVRNLMGAFGVLGGIALFVSIMKNAFDTIKKFEQGVADLSAITGATGKDLEYLKNQAIELGKGTKGGAVAVVEAYKLIASAKPELLENVSALNQVTEAVLRLSQASGMEMPDAAIALTDAMNQFNAPASEASKYVDVLAAGAKYGAAEIPQLTDAILEFGAVAKVSNVDIKESAALVELLAEKGIKGAQAGTAIRNIMLEINSGFTTKEARTELDKYGISFEKLKDKTIPFADKLELLKPLLSDTTSIVNTFKKENSAAAISLIANTTRLKELTDKVGEFGVAQEQANTRTDTLTGSIDKLESAWGSFILSLSEKGNAGGEFLKFWVNDAIATLDLLDGWFTSSARKREKELDAIRKEGADSANKHYSDKNKKSIEDLNNVIAWNNATIVENTRAAKELEKLNEKIAKDTSIGGAERYETILANRKKIAQLNNETVFAGAENASVKGFIQQRTAKPAKKPDDPKINSKKPDAIKKEALDNAKKLSDSLYELQKQRLERTIKINSEIAADDKMNDDVRIKSLELVQQKEIELIELTKQHSLDADKFVTAENKLNANQKLFIANEAANKKVDINKKTSEEIAKINEFDSKEYELELKRSTDFLTIANENAIAEEEKRFQEELALGYENDKAKEDAAKEHEKKLFDIKKSGLIAQTRLQINNLNDELNAYEAQSDGSQKSQDFILAKRAKVAELTSRLVQAEGETFIANEEDKSNAAKISIDEIAQISSESLTALSDLANAFTEAKIQKIDDEIAKNNEYYDRQIELAGNDARQKDLLQKEREKKNEELEKKKRKAQEKQAKYDKAAALAQAAIMTALAILNALNSKPFLPMGPIMATLAGVMGAVQIATIIATPIPKYKMGRKGGPAETAWVGDGGVSEVITSYKGMNPRLTPNIPTLTHLNEGDIVHKSMADYQAYMRASILSGIKMDSHRLNDFQANQNEEKYGKEMLDELKRNTRAIERQKNGSTINMPGLDINHHLWKMRNTNWN